MRNLTVRVQSEGEELLTKLVYEKKHLIGGQISRSKIRYTVFQTKLLFNLVKDLFKWCDDLASNLAVELPSEGENFDLGGKRKKYFLRCQFSRSKTRYLVFRHKLLFNLVNDLFKRIDGLGRSATVRVQSESEKLFDLGVIWKSTLYVVNFRAQKLAI